MKARWILKPSGDRAFYQVGQYIFTRGEQIAYHLVENRWYEVPSGQVSFQVSGEQVFTPTGDLAYCYEAKSR